MVIEESSLEKGLPKKTVSLCPECKEKIPAEIKEKDGKVVMEKDCDEHGHFESLVWSDVDLYLKAEVFAYDGKGVDNPYYEDATSCPENCGLCNLHKSHTCLANIDLTNRCNMNCPICFANANKQGYVYQPSYEEVVDMLKTLRAEEPVPTPAVQFSGGEPTVYPNFFEVIEKASELGFSQIQVATNGIKLANDEDFARKCEEAGLHTVYLQFDGLKEEIYIKARGRKMLDVKKKAIENTRKTKPNPLSTVLVPTIVKTVNDDQVGPILDFAIKNRDVVRGVNYQPVAFTGRIEKEERVKQRYTLPDLAKGLEEQTGYLSKDDFYPVPFVTPISQMVSVIKDEPQVAFTSHPHCGLASYLVIADNGEVRPITDFVDVEGLMAEMKKKADEWDTFLKKTAVKIGRKLKTEKGKDKSMVKNFKKYFGDYLKEEELPGGLTLTEIMKSILTEGDKDSVGKFAWRTLFVGGMHFQDDYNYDIERVKRCVIHYATPDGRIIPFCAYNGGPTYREEVEKKFSVPLDEWRDKDGR
ncbi:MAG: tetraether lipid synthase Tes [Candidatus Aenigmatarchaeota archaeon]